MATEINVQELLEANAKQQEALNNQRAKELADVKSSKNAAKLEANKKKELEDAAKRVEYFSSNIQGILKNINTRQTTYGTNQPIDDLVKQLENVVNLYNESTKKLDQLTKPTSKATDDVSNKTKAPTKVSPKAAESAALSPTPTSTSTPTSTLTPTTTPTPTVDSKVSSSSKTTTEANDKKNQINKIEDSVDLEKAGLNRAVLQYMKENYLEDYEAIKAQIDRSLLDKNLTAPEISRITSVFKNTNYYRKATVENNRTKIGSYFIANGLDSIANKDLIDKLTTDVFIKGVVTETQAQKQIRELSVEKLGLNITTDANKLRIKSSMLDGGNSFLTAASQYVATYASTLGISAAEFNAFENDGFLNAFRDSTSLDDFQIRVKADPRYINSVKGRQEIDSTKLALQNLHRNLGMGYSAKDIEDQAMSVVSGKTTLDQLEYGRRSIAAEAFPAFRDRILAGENIKQIASPYAYAQSRLLEIPESSIDISDPTSPIRKALIGDGKTPKPLWQFEQELFKDARWQYTSNARDTMDKITTDVLSRFGVMG